MIVTIVGGSGMIGRHLARSLVGSGHSVVVLTRDPDRARGALPAGLRLVRWTGSPSADVVAALQGTDAIVNLAGESIGTRPWTRGRKQAILESRVASTTAIVDAIRALPPESRPSVLLNASGSHVYEGVDAEPARETTKPSAPSFLGRVCLRWETTARQAEPLGVRVVVLRQAFVLAADAIACGLLALPFRLFLGGRLGSGRQWFSWIHVDDLVGLYRLALRDATIDGVLNAASPSPVRGDELAAALGRALHRPNWLPVPTTLLRLVMREQSSLILGSQRVVPVRAVEAGYGFRYVELEAALRDALVGTGGPVARSASDPPTR